MKLPYIVVGTQKEGIMTIGTMEIRFPGANLTENQRKVIEDKYLHDDPTVESWLWRVAFNVALAELLYNPAMRAESLKGVDCVERAQDVGCGQKSILLTVHKSGKALREQDRNFRRFMDNLNGVAETEEGKGIVTPVALRFFSLLSEFRFLPNSPTLMNAGRELQQLSACYVLPIEDAVDGWGDVVKQTMLIHKSGGGTGFSGCRVRPRGDQVKSTKGVASGAISPLRIINNATQEVKQGGTRRGANMGILPYWHPDIFEFIDTKTDEGKLENFNISVACDAGFMGAVERGEEIELVNPRTQEAVGRVDARELFQKMIENAWKTGDPGVVFLDRINDSRSNATPALGQIEATNPCGEQPLLPFEPCNLGSINLSKFVKRAEVDFDALGATVEECVRFLDDVIDVNNYPLPEIEVMAKGNRRIGLGVMGWAEMLALLDIPYASKKALDLAEELMGFLNQRALGASVDLAKERGVFPNFRDSIYDRDSRFSRGEDVRPRHCARTTIAPTGTIAIAAGLQGSGIEPFFALVYTRYNAKALDALRKGESPDPGDVYYEINDLFRTVAEDNRFFGIHEKVLWEKIRENRGSLRGIPEIPVEVQRRFETAHDVPVEWHVRHQAAFQKHTDNGVSKTINLPHEATVEAIKETYFLAYRLGCKGITVYRDGSKSDQVLNLGERKKKMRLDTREGVDAVYYKFETGYGPVHITVVGNGEGSPYRVFVNATPVGTEVSGLSVALGIILSKYLEIGGDPNEVRRHLNSIKSDRPYGLGPQRIESIPHAVSVALTRYMKKMGTVEEANGDGGKDQGKRPGETRDYCPKCYSPNIAYIQGCHGPTCFECGYSECS
jgi:ribonucleoside-diphosphate reductase alpha chain